jgi:filamentous hemagglutinin family protein
MRRHLTRSLLALTGTLLAASAMSVRAQALLPGTVAGTRVVPGVKTWVGAQPGGVTVNPDGSREMLIRQTQSRATLNWTQFDVDRGETVRFDQQGNRDWVALNWIHALKPSQIAGRLVADGAVYLINANGIVFKPGSQVDASAFIASTLSIKNDAFSKGLTAMARGQAAFEFDASAGSADARIEVQSGTVRRLDGSAVRAPDGSELVQAATISSADGGRVFLLGTREVINSGLIKSPNGQVILAAGSKVYLFAPTTADSAAFRGLFVEVEAGGANRNLGSVLNNGTIDTPLGNTTLMGMALRNAGRISADTSATANGSVYLYSRANPVFATGSSDRPLTTTSGTVQIAPTGVIEAPVRSNLAADGKPETVLDAQTVYPSEIRLAGQSIQLQGGGASGARLTAPGGLVSLSANENFADNSAIKPVGTGRIVIDAGASIDVSGIRGVSVPVSRNLIDVQVGGENVADNPTLRTGPLAQQTLKVDARVGSPLFTQSALDALATTQIKRTVEERMTAGGTVSLSSTGEAVDC